MLTNFNERLAEMSTFFCTFADNIEKIRINVTHIRRRNSSQELPRTNRG